MECFLGTVMWNIGIEVRFSPRARDIFVEHWVIRIEGRLSQRASDIFVLREDPKRIVTYL